MKEYVKYTIQLEADLKEKLVNYCKEYDIMQRKIVNEAIKEYLLKLVIK